MGNQDEYQMIFSKKLKYYMDLNGKKQQDIINDLGFKTASVSYWCSGERIPRMDKIQKLADYFGIRVSDLLEDKPVQLAQDELFEKKKILFSISNKASADDLDKIIQIVNMVVGDDND